MPAIPHPSVPHPVMCSCLVCQDARQARWNADADRLKEQGDANAAADHAGAEDDEPSCTNPRGHSWVTAEEDNGGDGRCYCEWCLADGDA